VPLADFDPGVGTGGVGVGGTGVGGTGLTGLGLTGLVGAAVNVICREKERLY
jgi:hypothetical protein